MKKLLSVLIAVLMLMQMFTFTVSAASAPSKVYWSEEYPGQINFTMVSGVTKYRIKLYKNNTVVVNTSHSFGDWDSAEGVHHFLEEIYENRSGTYRAEVGPDDGSNNFTSSNNYVYTKPSNTLAKPQNVVYNKNGQYITWNAVSGAYLYDVWFCYSLDGGESFFNMSSWQIDPQWGGCFVDLQYDMEYIEEEYQRAAEDEGVDVDDMIKAIQIVAYPRNLNDANLSYSDYVTFDGVSIPNDGNDNTGGTTSGGCVPQVLAWGEGGLVSFSLVGEDAKTCIIRLYKDDKMVDDTEYEIADYEMTFGVETFVFRETIARLGNGEYRFSVIMADENFEPYDDKEYFSDIYVYKVLEKVDRSSITDGKYIDGAKIAYDLGLMTNVYENPTAKITKGELCEIVVKMLGAEEAAKAMNSMNSYFSDIQTGTDLNGYVNYLVAKGVVNGESSSVFGASTEMLYEQIIKVLVSVLGFEPIAKNNGGYPNGYLYVASRYKITGGLVLAIGDTVTREQMAALVANAMQSQTMEQTSWGYQPTYKVTDESLLFQNGYSKISGIGYADQNTLTIDSGTLKDIDNLTGTEVTELELENYDYDIIALNGKDSTFYVKDNKAICGLLNYKASVKINNGDLSTSNRNVTLYLDVNGYTKYKIEDGSYSPITSKVSYVLPSVNHGYQSVNVTFANDDETRTQKVSDSIDFINIHKLTYMADGKVFKQVEVGCGEKIGYLTTIPTIDGYWFDCWEPLLPSVMPDEDVTVYAKFTPYTTVTGKITYNGEVAANKNVYVLGSTYTTDADGNFQFSYRSGIKQMTTIVSNYLSKSVYLDLTGRTFDLGTIDFTRMETTVTDSTNLISSVAGLENAFDQEDENYIDTTVNSVRVNVSVKSAEQTEEITKEVAKNYTDYEVVQNIDIQIEKYQGLNSKEVTETEGLLGFEVALPDESKGKSSYIVLREHEGSVDTLTTIPNADGEYFIINSDSIIIYAKKFSVYSLAATEVVSATKTETGVSFEINLNEQVVKDNALMIVKTYNSRGVQLASKAIPVTATYSDTVTLECEGATGYKLLFFNGLANIKPVYVPINGNL